MLWYMSQNSGWIKLMLLPVCCVTEYRKFIQAITLHYQQLKTNFLLDAIFKIIQTHTKCCFSYLQPNLESFYLGFSSKVSLLWKFSNIKEKWNNYTLNIQIPTMQILVHISLGFPGCQIVKTPSFHFTGMGSIPGWGTTIPHAMW